ncbi:hypothetical protein GALL_274380 [mine drainage metagenome]|jgi:prepilin-type N-terminal cleavage/methylation domain-containing protein|uniref:Type IV pilus modification protein PilV n=1 Tax=mine drainage metagenome TaxID=410659 RepID=A0A1J5R3U4_9ZZZZ
MRPDRLRQRGFGLLEVLIALLIFSLGMLGVSALYARTAPQPYTNGTVSGVQMAADALFAILGANPSVLPVTVSSAAQASSMPTTSLSGWYSQYAQLIPGLTVSIAAQNNANGTACSTSSCGVQLTLGWTQGSTKRSQVFHGQIGIQ